MPEPSGMRFCRRIVLVETELYSGVESMHWNTRLMLRRYSADRNGLDENHSPNIRPRATEVSVEFPLLLVHG